MATNTSGLETRDAICAKLKCSNNAFTLNLSLGITNANLYFGQRTSVFIFPFVIQPSCRRRFLTWQVNRGDQLILSIGAGMRSIARNILGLVLCVVVFAFAVIVDEMARRQFGGSMKIHGLPIGNASVTGVWHPDFMLWGKAWSIQVQSDEGLELNLDGRTYVIPEGSHIVYSNHDNTNTGQFGTQEFWGYPENVEVRPLDRKP